MSQVMSDAEIKEKSDAEIKEKRTEYYRAYEEHSKTLRAWFISLGVGGPGFLLAQTEISKGLNEKGWFVFVILLFLAGICLQALVVLLNKSIMWVNYYNYEPDRKGEQSSFLVWAADRLSEKIWIDIVADVITCILFAGAVVLILCSRI